MLVGKIVQSMQFTCQALTPIDRHSDVCCSTFTQPFGDWCFATAGPRLWNSLSLWTTSILQSRRVLERLL